MWDKFWSPEVGADFQSKNVFDRITYQNVIEDLNSLDHKKNFGDDITEHDLVVLSEKHKSFYFITDWPSEIKPFYISSYDD